MEEFKRERVTMSIFFHDRQSRWLLPHASPIFPYASPRYCVGFCRAACFSCARFTSSSTCPRSRRPRCAHPPARQSASIVNVCGIACTLNDFAIGPVNPRSKYCGQVI